MSIFLLLTTIFNFSYKVFNSFVICKTVSKLVVIYAPSSGRLCIDKGFSSYSSQMNMSTIVLRLHSAQGGTDSCRNARMHAVPRFSTENT